MELVETAKKSGAICHHDFTHYNVIHYREKLYVINFEYCCRELKMYDLANLIRRKMRKCGWDINEAKLILDQYKTIEDLTREEMDIIAVLLMFPQKFWRTSNRYYNSKRSWAEKNFIIRIKEVIDEIDCHKEFIKRFDQVFL